MNTRRRCARHKNGKGLVRAFDAGGETLRAFCDRKGLGMSTFREWRQHHSPTFRPRQPLPSAGFVEVTPGTSPLAITLQVGDELRIECPHGIGREAIAQLARSLVDGR